MADRRLDTPDTAHTIKHKTCTKCRQHKPVDEFGRNSSRKDGRQVWCKLCHNGANKKPAPSGAAQSGRGRPRKMVTIRAGWGVVGQPAAQPAAQPVAPASPASIAPIAPAPITPSPLALALSQPQAEPMASEAQAEQAPSQPQPQAAPCIDMSLQEWLRDRIAPSVWVGAHAVVMASGDKDHPAYTILTPDGNRPPFAVPTEGIEWTYRLLAGVPQGDVPAGAVFF